MNTTYTMSVITSTIKSFAIGTATVFCMTSCSSSIPTPNDTRYLADFHITNFLQQDKLLDENKLSLYVDYSTCNALGQSSRLFQEISASLVNRTTSYYAIQGSEINEVDIDANKGVFTLLRNIHEVNYAELAEAAKRATSANQEAVLLTDGEYYTPSIAKGHDNDPYLADAFKNWILKGHDIHIISEPYVEPCNGKMYEKKRFYIMFTDDRMPNNIYDRVRQTVDLAKYPNVDEFHISASHPQMKGNGNNGSTQDEILMSKSKGYGTFEIQDWDGCDWNTIEDNLVNVVDENTGEELPVGKAFIQMGIDKNSFGCYRIKGLDLKVYDINSEYNDFYDAKVNNEKVPKLSNALSEVENFMEIDPEEFNKHSKINIRFNKDWFVPAGGLCGEPYNYYKVDLAIRDVEPIFANHEDKFTFQSISKNGETNVSVASSIKQCLADVAVKAKMRGQVIYSIYIKTEKK